MKHLVVTLLVVAMFAMPVQAQTDEEPDDCDGQQDQAYQDRPEGEKTPIRLQITVEDLTCDDLDPGLPIGCEEDCGKPDPCENDEECEPPSDPCDDQVWLLVPTYAQSVRSVLCDGGDPCEDECDPGPVPCVDGDCPVENCEGDDCDLPGNCNSPDLKDCEAVQLIADVVNSIGDAASPAEVWPALKFDGGCTGYLSETEFEASLASGSINTPLVELEVKFGTISYSKTYYKVSCEVGARPVAWGENGFGRTVWLTQDGTKTVPCEYTGLPGNTKCSAPGEEGAAGAPVYTGLVEDGVPDEITAKWVGPRIGVEGSSYQGIDTITGSLAASDYERSVGITWNPDETTQRLLEDLRQELEDI